MQPEDRPLDPAARAGYYPTTLWSKIHEARRGGAESEQAWGILLERYRRPIQIQIEKYLKDDPENLAAEFISKVFVQSLVQNADRARGRFRGLLATALHRFVRSELRKRYAEKRGRGEQPVPLDELDLERGLSQGSDPDQFYRDLDREFAAELFQRAFEAVRRSFLTHGSAEEFELLIGREAHLSLEEISRRLSLSEDAAKVRRHRLRKALRAAMREEVSDLVSAEDVEDEVQHLRLVMEESISDQL